MTQIKNNERKWYLIDLDGKVFGRELSNAANLLIGKHKAEYLPNLDQGDYVVMINASKVKFTGNKLDQKMYYKHTGYIGNLKEISLKESMAKAPVDRIKKSVAGMLPKNKLRDDRLARLKVYTGNEHPHVNVKFEE